MWSLAEFICFHYIYHWAGCSTCPHCQGRKHTGTPKSVWNLKLPDVGACVRWLATGMSTRLRTIQCRMVMRAFARWPSRGCQPIRSSIAEKHYWYSRLLPGLSSCAGPILHLIIQGWIISCCSAQVMQEESTGFSFLCCLSMWIPRCVFTVGRLVCFEFLSRNEIFDVLVFRTTLPTR